MALLIRRRPLSPRQRGLLLNNKNLRRFNTLIVMDRVSEHGL
ncbi:MAG TPA: hypothetical protein VL101_05400 [Nordella sp.]|nr:hypothetical protein [Nordella sp.]